ncbi:MAG: N-acetyltransferase family protein [Candidatus Thorarchaeota archaeon]|jgi:ribosomal protein S18 acetylase RimI-like enzyme
MIDTRTATSDDIPLLVNMYRNEIEDHEERAQRFAQNLVRRYNTLLAIKDKAICGTVTWEPRGGLDDGVVEMIGLGVAEGLKRQGIASKLVDAMIEETLQFFSSKGYTLRVILLFMEKTNETARKFYSASRFKEVAAIPSLYPHDDASIWTRHL